MGPDAQRLASEATSDLDIITAAQHGFAFIIDHFDRLISLDVGWKALDVSHHSLQPDIVLEDVKYLETDNGNGTKDISYISRHVCKRTWPQMMDVYHDRRIHQDVVARTYFANMPHEEDDKHIYHTWLDEHVKVHDYKLQLGGTDRKDTIHYAEKFKHESPHGHGEVSMQFCIDTLVAPPHHFVDRDNASHIGGSAMFDHADHTTAHPVSNIYCVKNQTIPVLADVYEYLIKPMSLATEQQIVYGEKHSKATTANTIRCTKTI